MVRVNPPSSRAVVEIPETLVDRYVAQGWTVVGSPAKAEAPAKPFSQLNKAELEQVASDEDVDISNANTNEEIRAVIKAARDTK